LKKTEFKVKILKPKFVATNRNKEFFFKSKKTWIEKHIIKSIHKENKGAQGLRFWQLQGLTKIERDQV
jgi:hypothetical protein